MSYSVLWRDAAERKLLIALFRAANKPTMWAVVRSIDQRLQSDPGSEGESRDDANRRILFVRPFCILFQIEESSKTVVIEELSWVGS